VGGQGGYAEGEEFEGEGVRREGGVIKEKGERLGEKRGQSLIFCAKPTNRRLREGSAGTPAKLGRSEFDEGPLRADSRPQSIGSKGLREGYKG